MKHRLNKFYARNTFTSDAVIAIDVNIQDIISNFIVGFEALNASAVMTANPMACIKKIELVDGSDVLYSLDGYEAEALDWYANKGNFRANYNYAMNGGTIQKYIGLNFGRYLWDKEYAFDPKQFSNPQLRITLDIDAGGNSATANYVTVWANTFDDEVPTPKGLLVTREIKQYTMASAAHNYTELPIDMPYRNLYFRPFLLGTEPNQCVSNIKLSEDQDKKVPYDVGAQEIERCLLEKYPPVVEDWFLTLAATSKYLYCAPSTRVTATGAVWAAAAAVQNAAFYDGDGGRLKAIAAANASNTQIQIRGYVPHAVYEIPFGDGQDDSDWYDVRNLGSLRLDITGAASAAGYIFAQQVRTY